ncbi:hypothetical protein HA402_007208 [Bradysia odoriphaga]|nr:hypothetical protein HA402_007208 [Bradysia odoriphaga]
MKQILFLVMISCMVMIVLTAEKPRPKECKTVCSMEYDPVCAGAPGETSKTFGNECVMRNYNCENDKKLSVISEKECPGGGGVRLS